MSKYSRHKYTWERPFTSVRHDWSFVTADGGLNFHVSLTPGYGDTAGLEFHHTEAARYAPNDAPDHIDCPLTGGRCWHDGTSLYADEYVWPVVQERLRAGDHESIFAILEHEWEIHRAHYTEHAPVDDGALAPHTDPSTTG